LVSTPAPARRRRRRRRPGWEEGSAPTSSTLSPWLATWSSAAGRRELRLCCFLLACALLGQKLLGRCPACGGKRRAEASGRSIHIGWLKWSDRRGKSIRSTLEDLVPLGEGLADNNALINLLSTYDLNAQTLVLFWVMSKHRHDEVLISDEGRRSGKRVQTK